MRPFRALCACTTSACITSACIAPTRLPGRFAALGLSSVSPGSTAAAPSRPPPRRSHAHSAGSRPPRQGRAAEMAAQKINEGLEHLANAEK